MNELFDVIHNLFLSIRKMYIKELYIREFKKKKKKTIHHILTTNNDNYKQFRNSSRS